jgi:choline dehydrogenase
MSPTTDIFDYVIIGGRTAGALLTNRLSKDGASVCLLEAGPRDTNPLIHIPAGHIKNVHSRRLTWGFEAEASAGTGRSYIFATAGACAGWFKLV